MVSEDMDKKDGSPAPPTLRQVAVLAGVSPMTVSRTLSGAGRHVRADLQRRVFDAATTLGYRRNENARSMRPGHQSNLIGVAITDLANPYYSRLALGVERVAAEHGRRILLGNTGEDPARESQLVSDFRGRRVEGLIVIPVGGHTSHLRQAQEAHVPLVMASRAVAGIDSDTVILDDISGAYAGTIRVLEEGYRRIAFLGHGPTIFTTGRRYDGFARALAEFDLTPDPRLVRHAQDPESARMAMRELLQLPLPPTAVFSTSSRLTVGVLEAITEYRALPEKPVIPAVLAFDDVELAPLLDVPLLMISHHPEELGVRAAELLFDRLDTAGDPAPRWVELPVTVGDFSVGVAQPDQHRLRRHRQPQ